MEVTEAKERFIQSWGSLGSKWGINRTMAQIHALLLISSDLLSAEDIMDSLTISRGNVNMNIRTLIDWGLVYKEYKSGERREFFRGEKDIWTVTKRVMNVRRQRELEPMIKVLQEFDSVTGNISDPDFLAFKKSIEGIKEFSEQADKTIALISKSEENWFWNKFLKMMIK